MNRSLLSASSLFLLLVTSSSAVHAGNGTRPLFIRAVATACDPANLPPEAPELFARFDKVPDDAVEAICFTDQGVATQFGRFRTVYAGYRLPNNGFVTHFILTAADGSAINGRNRGVIPESGESTWFYAKFSGGTKRFRRAQANVAGRINYVSETSVSYRGMGGIDLNLRRR